MRFRIRSFLQSPTQPHRFPMATEFHHDPLHCNDDESPGKMQEHMVDADSMADGHDSDDGPPDSASLRIATTWTDQPVRLPAYTPSVAAKETTHDSPPTTPVDDPIYAFGSKKHFGFSARTSIASSIFPWHKNKPQVLHQYSPTRPPLSKRSSLAGLKVLPVSSPEAVKHLDDEEIDIVTCKGLDLAKRTLELLHMLEIPAWQDVTDPSQLEFFRISGAMTNCIFQVSGPPLPADSTDEEDASQEQSPRRRKVLMRVYGIGTDALFSRDKELYWLQKLAMMDIGPPLLGIFKNGRFEEYIESTTLTKEDIRDPRNSRHIAHRMCELHNLVNVFPPPEDCVPQSQENITRWLPLAKEAIDKICAKDPSKRKIMDDFDFGKLVVEIDEIYKELAKVHSPIVFSHNDTQYGNILRTTDGSGELVVIDFEYAGYNTRAFDIGNHFCEWTADYHSDRPSVLHPDRYPTKEEQLNFLEAYMEAEIAMTGYHLTAINIEKYHDKHHRRRSIRNAVASGIAKAVAATSSALRRRSTEGVAESGSSVAGPPTSPSSQQRTATSSSISAATTTSADSLTDGSTTFVALNEGGATTTPPTTTTSGGSSRSSPRPEATVLPGGGKGNSALENEASIKAAAAQAATTRKKGGDGGGGVTKGEILDSMYKEVNKFALTSHIMWGLWGLIQAPQSEIDFDYFEYALQRLNEFRRRRDEFMNL